MDTIAAHYEDDGTLIIEMKKFVRFLSDESKVILAKELSLNGIIIKDVFDQILDGSTRDGSCGATDTGWSFHPSAINYCRGRVAESAPEAAKNEIRMLKTELENLQKRYQSLLDNRYDDHPF